MSKEVKAALITAFAVILAAIISGAFLLRSMGANQSSTGNTAYSPIPNNAPPSPGSNPVSLSKTSFNLPDDGTSNNNGYIGPFCCTGKTATVFTKDSHPVGYIYFYSWHGQAFTEGNNHSFAPDISILVSGLTDLSNVSSQQEKSSIDFMASEMTLGASRSTQAGSLYFTVTIESVTIQTSNGQSYYDMQSVSVKVVVSTSAT